MADHDLSAEAEAAFMAVFKGGVDTTRMQAVSEDYVDRYVGLPKQMRQLLEAQGWTVIP